MTAVYCGRCPEGEERALARRLLALALERELGMTDLPRMERLPGGKPWFPDWPQVHFNLSHSHGAAVCALSQGPVGVDVELRRQPPRRLSAGMEPEAFWRLWTGREATVKREGKGLAALLAAPDPDGLCQWREDLLEGYTAAVCPSDRGEIRWIKA